MKKIIILLFVVSFLFPAGGKEKKIRQLLAVTGSADLGIQVMDQMITSFKQSMPDVPAAFWDEFMKGVKTDELVNLTIPIYDKYFTEADIDAMIKFYQTPVGKKTIRLMPQIMQESMMVGQEWGQRIGKQAMEKLQADGFR